MTEQGTPFEFQAQAQETLFRLHYLFCEESRLIIKMLIKMSLRSVAAMAQIVQEYPGFKT